MKSKQINFEKTVQSRKSTQLREIGAVDSSRNANLRNCKSMVKVTDGQNMKNILHPISSCLIAMLL